jgi:hypothetical protein
MSVWTFYNFLDARGENVIKEWMNDEIPWEAKLHINGKLVVMRAMPNFPPKWVSPYKGYPNIMELRFPYRRVQYRPLGYYGPQEKQFTLLIGAIEKGGNIRKGILDTATERMRILNRMPPSLMEECICEHEYD